MSIKVVYNNMLKNDHRYISTVLEGSTKTIKILKSTY